MLVNCQTIDILLINESKESFLPLFLLTANDIYYEVRPNGMRADKYLTLIKGLISVNYFNAQAGYYEPAIDTFEMEYQVNTNGLSNETKINIPYPINVNVTLDFATCLC